MTININIYIIKATKETYFYDDDDMTDSRPFTIKFCAKIVVEIDLGTVSGMQVVVVGGYSTLINDYIPTARHYNML